MNKATAPPKDFDCMEMKRRIQERIHAETRGMSQDELLSYFRRRVAASRFARFFGHGPKAGRGKRVVKMSGREPSPAARRRAAQPSAAARD